MIKVYEWNNGLWRFEEGKQPAGAVEHKPKPKKRRTRNKSRTAANKEASDE